MYIHIVHCTCGHIVSWSFVYVVCVLQWSESWSGAAVEVNVGESTSQTQESHGGQAMIIVHCTCTYWPVYVVPASQCMHTCSLSVCVYSGTSK